MSNLNNVPYDQNDPRSRDYIPCLPPTPTSSTVPSPAANKTLRGITEHSSSLKHELSDDSKELAEQSGATAVGIAPKEKKPRLSKKLISEDVEGLGSVPAIAAGGGELKVPSFQTWLLATEEGHMADMEAADGGLKGDIAQHGIGSGSPDSTMSGRVETAAGSSKSKQKQNNKGKGKSYSPSKFPVFPANYSPLPHRPRKCCSIYKS